MVIPSGSVALSEGELARRLRGPVIPSAMRACNTVRRVIRAMESLPELPWIVPRMRVSLGDVEFLAGRAFGDKVQKRKTVRGEW